MYKTSNLYLASYLRTVKEISFIGTKRTGSGKKTVIFLFSPENLAEEAIDDFYAGNALVDPQILFQHLSSLKDIIFESARKEEL